MLHYPLFTSLSGVRVLNGTLPPLPGPPPPPPPPRNPVALPQLALERAIIARAASEAAVDRRPPDASPPRRPAPRTPSRQEEAQCEAQEDPALQQQQQQQEAAKRAQSNALVGQLGEMGFSAEASMAAFEVCGDDTFRAVNFAGAFEQLKEEGYPPLWLKRPLVLHGCVLAPVRQYLTMLRALVRRAEPLGAQSERAALLSLETASDDFGRAAVIVDGVKALAPLGFSVEKIIAAVDRAAGDVHKAQSYLLDSA
eukprot:m51a1_g13978 hypothetical protein (254) ;mRNA; r:1005648-1006459